MSRWVFLVPVLVLAGAACLVYWLLSQRDSAPREQCQGMLDIPTYLLLDREYLVFIGVPPSHPSRWTRVIRLDGDDLVDVHDHRYVLGDVSAAIVAYPNGEILEEVRAFRPFPDGIDYIQDALETIRDVLDVDQLSTGRDYVKVEHTDYRSAEDGRLVYLTTVTNIGSERIRVLKLGGYLLIDGEWTLHTITGGYFTAEQFRSWYAVEGDGWISPGETVSDPDNFGNRGALWAYFCETESGVRFVAGAKVN
ncbi:hypothetical protein LCGC14_0203950 [marine sediment metagenome]|uniref:Uncharacterized protein n=1 Tax=marine sediment metagenome TaxID=412755 RepID=A0A0F9UZF6_9ZZZZ|nr:hypothetical protein [Phycisphaerae bacterium]HDZ43462.1 hypothetical protein [Phycisphaerae bacterium]